MSQLTRRLQRGPNSVSAVRKPRPHHKLSCTSCRRWKSCSYVHSWMTWLQKFGLTIVRIERVVPRHLWRDHCDSSRNITGLLTQGPKTIKSAKTLDVSQLTRCLQRGPKSVSAVRKLRPHLKLSCTSCRRWKSCSYVHSWMTWLQKFGLTIVRIERVVPRHLWRDHCDSSPNNDSFVKLKV